jgi:hypothetical protein
MAVTDDDEIDEHRVRCQSYLLELQMLGHVEAKPAPTAAEVAQATGAIISEVSAAGRAALTAGSRRHPGVGPFLEARLNRLVTAAEEVIAAARDGDSAALRRVLHRFEALTSAIWTVQDAVRGPAGPLGQPPENRDPTETMHRTMA